METKEELKRKLEEIEEKERAEIIDAAWPEFEKLIGKCFKYRNSYSCPKNSSDYWWRYTKIVEINKDDLYLGGIDGKQVLANCRAMAFQRDKYGLILINPSERNYVHSLGTEITEQAFNKAWGKIKKQINEI